MLALLLAAVLLFGCIGLIKSAGARAETASWSAQFGTVAPAEKGVLLSANEEDLEAIFQYEGSLDFVSGTQFDFDIPKGKFYARESGSLPEGSTAAEFRAKEIAQIRTEDNDYLTFCVTAEDGRGLELKARALFADEDALYNKMMVDVTYVGVSGERDYTETFETYRAIFSETHTFAIVRENGYYFASFDGISAIPVAKYSDMDLSSASFHIKMRSRVLSEIAISEPERAEQKFVTENWATFGATDVSTNEDGTLSFLVQDMRVRQYNGTRDLRIREEVINLKGYDVRYPIVLEGCYDINETMAVWWGLGLGRTPFDTAGKLVYHPDGSVKQDYDSNTLIENDGIMFQTTTGIAQQQVQNHRIEEYVTNAGTTGYSGYENLDRIIIEVGENSTTITYNGTVIFEDMSSKRSDFKDGRLYPFFHFIGTPANPYKQNRVIIKGVNQPILLSDEIPEVRLGTPSFVSIFVDNHGGKNGALKVYKDRECSQPFDESSYNYDKNTHALTISASQFNGFAVGLQTIWLANGEGITAQVLRVRDPNAVYLPADVPTGLVFDPQGEEDLTFTADLKNNEFVRIAGSGLGSSNYETSISDGKLTVTIRRAFLRAKPEGVYSFRIITRTAEQDELESEFFITVGNPAAPSSTPVGLIVGVCAGVAVLIGGVVAGILIWKQKKGGK